MQKFFIKNKDEMAKFAKDFAAKISNGIIIGLKGDLGVGKSFFAQNFINSLLDKKTEILSPTFNLVCSYNSKRGKIFHFDLYRLKNFEDLENIGFFDGCKNSICLIEWPQIAKKFLEKLPYGKYIELEIKIIGEEEREVFVDNHR
ncbi:MAG TPA: tRNA (adenosine(37)-N6)-threonylcarbamoyltransferase complex ATPase subunit type 1 TsaE [Rickettsiales bacterium]|nr:tRNA (adenosine(37)-N6)-threonylcarbamoyltransferase complex ATPase subunit type 1 TsaE [Rickettsiales bacterium]